ncbi:hypothetical protein LSAT2_017895, partial [Lamellibrachia satsuma]
IAGLSLQYNTTIAGLINTHAPFTTRVITIRPQTPWYNNELSVARDEWTGSGERRVDRRWQETSGPAVARDDWTGSGERRVDRRWRETSGPAVARDEWTFGGERRADRRWRETRLVVHRDISTTLRYL